MPTVIGKSASTANGGPMGNPWLAPDGSVANGAPSSATSTVSALEAQRAIDVKDRERLEARFPRTISPRDQAQEAGAEAPERYGSTGLMRSTTYPLPKSSAQLMNASGSLNTNR
jgi:hypothetical protein